MSLFDHHHAQARKMLADYREIAALDRELVRRHNAERIAARFYDMNTAREARRQMRASAVLAFLAFVLLLATLHDAPARIAATALEAQTQGGW